MEQIILQTLSVYRLDEGDWEQSAWIYEGEICSTSLIAFYGEMTCSVDEREQWTLYCGFNKASDSFILVTAFSCHNLTDKLRKLGQGKRIESWTEI